MTNGIAGLLLLATMSVAYSGCSSSMERFRLSVSNRQVATMLGVFTFAGIVCLPTSCIPILVAVVYLAAWPTFRRSGAPLHRHVYNAANVLLACLIAKAAMAAVPATVAIPVAILSFMAVNLCLVIAAIVTARQFAALAMFKNPRTYLVVLATQLLGAAVGTAMHWHLALGLLGLPAMFGVHAAAVRGTVADTQARIDVAWREDAWLVIARRSCARIAGFPSSWWNQIEPRIAKPPLLCSITLPGPKTALVTTELTSSSCCWQIRRPPEQGCSRDG
jgi:hypothetical protein